MTRKIFLEAAYKADKEREARGEEKQYNYFIEVDCVDNFQAEAIALWLNHDAYVRGDAHMSVAAAAGNL